MRVLFVAVPQAGHLTPLLPLAGALDGQGDEVQVATGADVAGAVSDAGLPMAPVGHGLEAWFPALAARIRGRPGEGLPPARILRYFVPRLFGEIAVGDMIDGVLRAAEDQRSDLVVYEPYAFAGPLAAAVLGIPAVHHSIGPAFDPDVDELAADALSPLWREFGLDVRDPAARPTSTVAICPPTLESPKEGAMLMQPIPPPGRAPSSCPDRPLIYVTLGTFSNRNLTVFRTVLDGLAHEDVDVVVTTGRDTDPDDLRPWPDNAQVERFIPQADLLPRCAAAINHGGSGTMFGALAHGLPQLVIPQSADNYVNAGVIERAGLGRQLLPADFHPESVAAGVATVLAAPQAARRCATEIAFMPAPSEVADALRRRHDHDDGAR